MTDTATLKRSPFHDLHTKHGGHMVPYAGWELPIRYGSIIDEHRQVRESGGFFDVSHMGRLRFRGRHARRFLDRVCSRRILGMVPGQVRYSLVCNEQGGCRDDVLVYCIEEDEYLMVCNAANRAKLLEHFEAERGDMTFKFKDETESTAMCAIQGPKVMDIVSALSSQIPNLKRYRFAVKNLLLFKLIVSRTGYTGEDGVEVILDAKMAKPALSMLLKNIDEDDAPVKPCGLGARDSLRLEAGMPLYGHEITEEIDPLTAGLGFAVALDKGEKDEREGTFIGQDALKRIAEAGPTRALVGLVGEGRRSPRQEMVVKHGAETVGVVTSGCLSPCLDRPIALAYVPVALAEPGTKLAVDLGRAEMAAEVVKTPFEYRK